MYKEKQNIEKIRRFTKGEKWNGNNRRTCFARRSCIVFIRNADDEHGIGSSSGNRMKSILEKLKGVLVGAAITAVIQSSSATTVMVVGFVNSGLMTLKQAVWVIMGANIGTTITGQLIALDIGAIAPLFAIAGVGASCLSKVKRYIISAVFLPDLVFFLWEWI